MDPQSVEVDVDSRIRQLEARNRRLERIGLLALALLLVMGFVLVQQRWSGAGAGDPIALLLDQNRKPEAVVHVTPSGEIRLESLRADGTLPRLDAKGVSQNGNLTLYDASGQPRMIFGSSAGEVAKASLTSVQTPARPSAMTSPDHSCNLNHPAGASDSHGAVAQGPKKEEGEAAAVTEELAADGSRVKTVLFKNLKIDGLYPSMTGPRKQHRLALGTPDDKHVWVTGFRAEVLDTNNNAAGQQFMCHTALDVVGRTGSSRESYRGQAFTVSQGQTAIDFPAGFAMKVPNAADMQQDLLVQVLNNNDPQLRRDVNFRATVRYFGDQDARARKLIPLSLTGGSVHPIVDAAAATPQEAVAKPALNEEIFTGPDGRRRTGHWLVPPGRQVMSTQIPLSLERDTTVHYMWMHVHPYAESVELRDVTANRSVWKGRVQNDPDPKRKAVVSTETFSSSKGVLLHKDHSYELVATYANPTAGHVDAMASLWMYVRSE